MRIERGDAGRRLEEEKRVKEKTKEEGGGGGLQTGNEQRHPEEFQTEFAENKKETISGHLADFSKGFSSRRSAFRPAPLVEKLCGKNQAKEAEGRKEGGFFLVFFTPNIQI